MFCASIPSYLAAVDGVRWSSEGCGDIGGGVLGDGVGGEGESPCMYFDGRVWVHVKCRGVGGCEV